MQELTGRVPQALTRQNHDCPAHARHDMQWNHRTAWRTTGCSETILRIALMPDRLISQSQKSRRNFGSD
jgi:hypothetical protein